MNDRAPALTRIDLFNVVGKIERTFVFGAVQTEEVHDASRRTVTVAAGAVFALMEKRVEASGVMHSRIAVLKAVASGEAFTTHPNVAPGAEILLDLRGWMRVQAVLEAIESVRRTGFKPEAAALDYWRHVGARVGVSLPPRPYSRRRHRASLLRRLVRR